MEKTLAGLLGAGLGVYLITVAYQGNTKELLSLLKEEKGYIEFVVSLYVLYLIHEKLPVSPITDVVTYTAVLGVILRAVGKTDITTIVQSFANGDKSLFDTAKALFGYEV